MRTLFLARSAVCLSLLVAWPAFSQPPDAASSPEDLDKLVASMAGDNLPRAAQNRGKPDSPPWRAAMRLASMKDGAVPALARGVESDDRMIRLNAVFVLNKIGTPATLALRIKCASDPDPEVRSRAIAGPAR